MAKRNDRDARRTELLPDPDDLYFDDDLDTVTRGLPTESDYLPPEEEEAEEARPLTEGVGRIGVRMVGLPSEPEEYDDYMDDEAEEEEEAQTVYAAPRRSAAEADPDEDEYLTPRQRAMILAGSLINLTRQG